MTVCSHLLKKILNIHASHRFANLHFQIFSAPGLSAHTTSYVPFTDTIGVSPTASLFISGGKEPSREVTLFVHGLEQN